MSGGLPNAQGSAGVPRVPDFDLLRPIGAGGFGSVWLAANRTTGALRAVKVIPRRAGAAGQSGPGPSGAGHGVAGQSGADPAGREAGSLARLEAALSCRDPRLLAVLHAGTTEEHLFLVLEAADDAVGGRPTPETVATYAPATLESRLVRGPLPPEECLACGRSLLGALAALHEAGMVHRDVKPSNCLFVGGELKLGDFGLVTEARPEISRLGTLKYMPPDGRMDHRANVYAAGLVLYEMVSGLPAERFPHLGDAAARAAADPLMAALVRVTLRACRPRPADRYANARRMAQALEEEAAAGRSGALAGPSAHGPSRRAALVALLAGVAALLGAGAWLLWPGDMGVPVNFITLPRHGAVILLDGVEQVGPDGALCRTPCTVEGLPPRVHRVAFRWSGESPVEAGSFDFASIRQVTARLP